MAVFYTNRAGETSVIEVGPKDQSLGPVDLAKAFIQERFFSNSNTDSPWGPIVGGEREWQPSAMERPLELLKEGDDLSKEWNSIRSTLKDVKTRGYEYQGPFDQNSNTFVSEALRNARLPAPTGNVTDQYGNTTHYWAPGADHLANPINQDQPSDAGATFNDRFEKWGSVPFGVTSMAAPDFPGSFDNRFGSWSFVPLGGFGDTDFPPTPQKSSAAPSGPSPTFAQASPTTPAFQRDGVYSPAGNFFGYFPRTSGVAAAPTASNTYRSSLAPAWPDFDAPAQGFSQLMSTGPFAGNNLFLPAAGASRSGPPPWQTPSGNPTQAAPPLQPDTTPDAVDELPVRRLGRSTYSLSQGPAFDDAAVQSPAAPAAPQGPLTLNEAYLEYRKRLDASQLSASAFDTSAPAAPRNPSSIALAPDDGGPLSLMEAYQQYRRRLDASQPPASAFDAGAPAAPLVPSDDSNFSGGLVGRLTALMRQYPEMYGPPPQEDADLPSYYRLMPNR